MPLNGQFLGQKFDVARNPPWTKLGKKGKPGIGPRANNQKPGMEGTGRQGVIRTAFAQTAYAAYGTYGKDERGMPNMANAVGANFPPNLRKSPEAKIQERRQASARRHAQTGAKLSGASANVGAQVPIPPEYPYYPFR